MNVVDVGGIDIGGGARPRVMGIVNLSPESPHTESVFSEASDAATYVDTTLIDEGADIVDVGLGSAEPDVDRVDEDAEQERLERAIELLDLIEGEAIMSIETRYASVAASALDAGFDMVNDVCGFADPEMAPLVTERNVPVVKMAGPGDVSHPGKLSSVDAIFEALAADPLPPKAIIDPAFGDWGRENPVALDREMFRRLDEFLALDRPILVSLDQKPVLGDISTLSEQVRHTRALTATALAINRGVSVIRTHEVASTCEAVRFAWNINDHASSEAANGVRRLHLRNRRVLERHLEQIGAPRARAYDGFPYIFEIEHLSNIDQTLLAHIIEDVGGTLATGRDSARVILCGTARTFRQLRAQIEGESNQLEAVLDRMIEETE